MPRTTPILIAALDPSWRDDINYDIGNLKAYEGKIYQALTPSGPNTNAGVCRPDESPEQWKIFQEEPVEYIAGDGIKVVKASGTGSISVDDSVVRTKGNQSVSGRKTFTTDVIIDNPTDSSELDFIVANTVKGTKPATNRYAWVNYYDSTNSVGDATYASTRFGYNGIVYDTAGNVHHKIAAYQGVAGSQTNAVLDLVYPEDGEPYLTAPATRATPANNEVVTVGYLDSADSGVVHTTGNETISGLKEFTGSVRITGDDLLIQGTGKAQYPDVDLQMIDYVRGETEVDNGIEAGITIYDSKNNYKGDAILADCRYRYDAVSKRSGMVMHVYDAADHSGTTPSRKAALGVYVPYESGDAYALAPTTPANATTNEIVTVDYLMGENSGVVHTNGNESIEGTKTFIGTTVLKGDLQCLGYGGTDTFDIDIKDPTIVKGNDATGIKSTTITWHDGTYIEGSSIDNKKVLGQIIMAYSTVGEEYNTSISLKPYRPVANSTESVSLEVHATPTEAYVLAPSTRETPAENELITYNFLQKYVADAIAAANSAK